MAPLTRNRAGWKCPDRDERHLLPSACLGRVDRHGGHHGGHPGLPVGPGYPRTPGIHAEDQVEGDKAEIDTLESLSELSPRGE